MSDYADPEKYEELMGALQTFISRVSEACSNMEAAGDTCVDCMDGDPSAVKSNDALRGCTRFIREAASEAQKIIAALQEELEEICSLVEEDF